MKDAREADRLALLRAAIPVDAEELIVHHEYQRGHAVSIFCRSRDMCWTVAFHIQSQLNLRMRQGELTLHCEDRETGYPYHGCRLAEDMEILGWMHALSIGYDDDGAYVQDNLSYLCPGGDGACTVRWSTNGKIAHMILVACLKDLKTYLGFATLDESVIYPDELLANGAVRTSVPGVCRVATGEYVSSALCSACGGKTGFCRVAKSMDEVLSYQRSNICEVCARKQAACGDCAFDDFCEEKGEGVTPATCEDFEWKFFSDDPYDETMCSCPIGGDK